MKKCLNETTNDTMLSEWATYDELNKALLEARMYGFFSINSKQVRKEFKKGAKKVFHRVNTPKHRLPVLYMFINETGGPFATNLVLQGSEGESFAVCLTFSEQILVIHSHAINRYIERRKFDGTIEQAQRKLLDELEIHKSVKDSTDETQYIYFDGGIFLCQVVDRVFRLRTFIMNRQCSPMQRMKSLQSEKELEQIKREIGII